MNYLAILREELNGDAEAYLRGDRAQRALETHQLREGLQIAALLCGGRRGSAVVQTARTDEVHLTLQLTQTPPPVEAVETIVAVPRPQTVRKLLQLTATLGIASLSLLKTHRVVKSYLASKRLNQDSIQEDVLLGLEQSGSTHVPNIQVHPRFTPFIEDVLPRRLDLLTKPLCLIADTKAAAAPVPALESPAQTVIVAIGPESGWEEGEVGRFQALGFQPISLGPRVMRVETAYTWLLAQIALLRQQAPQR